MIIVYDKYSNREPKSFGRTKKNMKRLLEKDLMFVEVKDPHGDDVRRHNVFYQDQQGYVLSETVQHDKFKRIVSKHVG